MTRRLARDERGFTLIELLIVSSLFIVVLGATLTAVTGFDRNTQRATKQNENAEDARTAIDRLNRQVRNLAKRLDQPVIAIATAHDFMFQTSDPQRTWVRWCLQAGTGLNGSARLWFSQRAAGGAPGSPGPCPGSGWDRSFVVSDAVTNLVGNRQMFSYVCLPDRGPACPVTADDFPLIKGVTSQLYIDRDMTREPREIQVSSAVYLRNQNERPIAAFSWRPSGVTRRVQLNGAASTDPEGRTLKFYWYKGTTAPTFTCDVGPPPEPSPLTGTTPTYTFPAVDGPAGTTVPFTLVVCDPGDLMSLPVTVGVQIPA